MFFYYILAHYTLLYHSFFFFFFFFNDTATTEIYTLSLHDALPICQQPTANSQPGQGWIGVITTPVPAGDRKSTRLNSSHLVISYAVFCLKKKKKTQNIIYYEVNIFNRHNRKYSYLTSIITYNTSTD